MRKYGLGVILIVMALCVFIYGCSEKNTKSKAGSETDSDSYVRSEESASKEKAASDDVIEITEKMYVAYINDIYTNTSEYLNRIIKIEGMFTTEEYDGNNYYYVYRVGPGCCGNDGSMCGFEFKYDGDMPKDNEWIEVIGELISYEENGVTYLSLQAESVTVKSERGKETVNQ